MSTTAIMIGVAVAGTVANVIGQVVGGKTGKMISGVGGALSMGAGIASSNIAGANSSLVSSEMVNTIKTVTSVANAGTGIFQASQGDAGNAALSLGAASTLSPSDGWFKNSDNQSSNDSNNNQQQISSSAAQTFGMGERKDINAQDMMASAAQQQAGNQTSVDDSSSLAFGSNNKSQDYTSSSNITGNNVNTAALNNTNNASGNNSAITNNNVVNANSGEGLLGGIKSLLKGTGNFIKDNKEVVNLIGNSLSNMNASDIEQQKIDLRQQEIDKIRSPISLLTPNNGYAFNPLTNRVEPISASK